MGISDSSPAVPGKRLEREDPQLMPAAPGHAQPAVGPSQLTMDLKSENFFGLEEKLVFSVFLDVFKFFCFLVILYWFLAVSLSENGWPHQLLVTVSMLA